MVIVKPSTMYSNHGLPLLGLHFLAGPLAAAQPLTMVPIQPGVHWSLKSFSSWVVCCAVLCPGDLVVEYMGHLVRPQVADRLEAQTYNQMVGAGEGRGGHLAPDAMLGWLQGQSVAASCVQCMCACGVGWRLCSWPLSSAHVAVVYHAVQDWANGPHLCIVACPAWLSLCAASLRPPLHCLPL